VRHAKANVRLTETPPNQLLLSRTFASFEELAELVRQWNTDFRQVGVPETGHEVLQVSMGGMLLSRARFGCHV